MVVFSQMRPGVASYTSDAEDRAFMEMGPLLMTGLALRLTPNSKAGKLEYIMACFEKDCVLMTKVEDGFLAMSVDTPDALEVFHEVEEEILKLSNPPLKTRTEPVGQPVLQ
jgi:hypothetical protein